MDLDQITICDRKARIAKSTIELLEQLPLNVPNQRNCLVQAYRDAASPEIINIDLLYKTHEVADEVTIEIPEGAVEVKRDKYWLKFDYRGQHYFVRVDVDVE